MNETAKATEFKNAVARVLANGDRKRLLSTLKQYSSDGSSDSNRLENEVLQLIGMYGYSGRTAIYQDAIELLLGKGIEPNIETCAFLCFHEKARELVREDPKVVDAAVRMGLFPLHAAAERGDIRMVRFLCDQGADPNHLDDLREPAISHALHAGPWKSEPELDVVAFLQERTNLANELWFAAASGDIDTASKLLARYPNEVQTRDEHGQTPLYHACHNNQIKIVQLLLESGADPNAENEGGDTPLHTACLHRLSNECDPEIIDLLLQHGAVLSIEAAVVTNQVDQMESLLDGSQGEEQGKKQLALLYAIHTKTPRCLERLIELGVQIDDRDWDHIVRIFGDDTELMTRLKNKVKRT